MQKLKINKEKVISVITNAEKLIKNTLVQPPCKKPGRCAVGELLFRAGITNKDLRLMEDSPDEFPTERLLLLYRHYGLTRSHLGKIVGSNDNCNVDGTYRKVAVSEIVNTVNKLKSGQFEEGWDFDGEIENGDY